MHGRIFRDGFDQIPVTLELKASRKKWEKRFEE